MVAAPFISRDDIRAVLDGLIHAGQRPSASGLERLLIVELALTAPDMPPSDEARAYAVRDLLVTETARALDQQRALFRLLPLDLHASAVAAQHDVEQMVRVGARELLLWCVLYYRYVRSDLDWSVERLAQLIAVHPRTLPRYQEDALELLTERVIGVEQEARRAQLRRHLLTMLPYSVPQRLFGRHDLLDAVTRQLPTLSPRHLLISGPAGIGKTSFAQELLRRQIDAGELDYLIWLEAPISTAYVQQQLTERLLRENTQLPLRDFLLLYRVALVLDGIDALIAEPAPALRALLSDCGAAELLLLNRAPVAQELVEAHVALPELDFAAATAFVETLLRSRQVEAGRAEAAQVIADHVGGVPLELRLATALWEQGHDWPTLESAVRERLLERLYASFDTATRWAWCALALFPGDVQRSVLVGALQVAERSLDRLARHELVTWSAVEQTNTQSCALIGAARDFIRQQADAGAVAAAMLGRLDVDAALLELVEQVLISGFPELEPARRLTWIRQLWREGLRQGHWARWRQILENAVSTDSAAELRTAYGVCLRRLNEWPGADQVFHAVVNDCGRLGLFGEQARALLEWSILARYQGQYERAEGLATQAQRYAERVRDAALLRAAALQHAQIAVEQGKSADAQRRLVGLPETVPVLALSSEVQYRLGSYEACRALALRALRLCDGADLSAEAGLRSLIGRSYQAQADLAPARAQMSAAVSLLERLNDIYALARAQSNLAGILMPLGQLGDASRLLASAELTQKQLGDRVGLSATRHNLALLGGGGGTLPVDPPLNSVTIRVNERP